MMVPTTRAAARSRLDDSRPDVHVDAQGGALETVSGPLDRLLADFLDAQVLELRGIDPRLGSVGHEVADLVAVGGKRLRPAFVYWGHRATGAEHHPALFALGGAVELLHTFALVHDDVMDRSAWRRGRPAVHASLAALHDAEGLCGDSAWFGVGGAILAGDLAFVWADRLFDGADLAPEPLARARRVFTELRVEVMAGQYLDLRLAAEPAATGTDALRVALLKSGRYTVTRPLQMGAAVAGCPERLDACLAAYGDAIGLAFQLRDDILGLFGDPATTGKGAAEDLREGKRTLLVLRALELADGGQRSALLEVLGDPDLDSDAAERARAVVVDTGALGVVEDELRRCYDVARSHLGDVPEPAAGALHELAELALYRAL